MNTSSFLRKTTSSVSFSYRSLIYAALAWKPIKADRRRAQLRRLSAPRSARSQTNRTGGGIACRADFIPSRRPPPRRGCCSLAPLALRRRWWTAAPSDARGRLPTATAPTWRVTDREQAQSSPAGWSGLGAAPTGLQQATLRLQRSTQGEVGSKVRHAWQHAWRRGSHGCCDLRLLLVAATRTATTLRGAVGLGLAEACLRHLAALSAPAGLLKAVIYFAAPLLPTAGP